MPKLGEMIAEDAAHFRRRAALYARALQSIARATQAKPERLRELAAETLKRKPLAPKRKA